MGCPTRGRRIYGLGLLVLQGGFVLLSERVLGSTHPFLLGVGGGVGLSGLLVFLRVPAGRAVFLPTAPIEILWAGLVAVVACGGLALKFISAEDVNYLPLAGRAVASLAVLAYLATGFRLFLVGYAEPAAPVR